MANASLNNLGRKQSLIQHIKIQQLSKNFSSATRRFYRKQLGTLGIYLLACEGRYFLSTLDLVATGFHRCVFNFLWYY